MRSPDVHMNYACFGSVLMMFDFRWFVLEINLEPTVNALDLLNSCCMTCDWFYSLSGSISNVYVLCGDP